MTGYTRTVRPPESYTEPLKLQQIASLRLPGGATAYEEDHFIPLEVGGHPRDPRNLWPEPYGPVPGAREKDRVETFLHDQVCAGRLALEQAQQSVQNDWYAIYLQIAGAPPRAAIGSATGASTTSNPALAATPNSASESSDAGTGHAYYASGAANASNIYCDTDSDWKRLSPANLQQFPSLEAAQAAHPSYKLHQAC